VKFPGLIAAIAGASPWSNGYDNSHKTVCGQALMLVEIHSKITKLSMLGGEMGSPAVKIPAWARIRRRPIVSSQLIAIMQSLQHSGVKH
jgi:hypothetical protein